MKKEMFTIGYRGKRDQYFLVTGYKSKVPGLAITTDYGDAKRYDIKSYSITHIKSGIGFFLGRFSSIRKAAKVLNKFLSGFDWTRDAKTIQADEQIKEAYQKADKYIAEQDGR